MYFKMRSENKPREQPWDYGTSGIIWTYGDNRIKTIPQNNTNITYSQEYFNKTNEKNHTGHFFNA